MSNLLLIIITVQTAGGHVATDSVGYRVWVFCYDVYGESAGCRPYLKRYFILEIYFEPPSDLSASHQRMQTFLSSLLTSSMEAITSDLCCSVTRVKWLNHQMDDGFITANRKDYSLTERASFPQLPEPLPHHWGMRKRCPSQWMMEERAWRPST